MRIISDRNYIKVRQENLLMVYKKDYSFGGITPVQNKYFKAPGNKYMARFLEQNHGLPMMRLEDEQQCSGILICPCDIPESV